MRILKFGGSSMSKAVNLNRCIEIINPKNTTQATILVISAFEDVTDNLLRAAQFASIQDEAYSELISELEKQHIQLVKETIPVANQASVLSQVIRKFNDLEVLLNGCFLLGELSAKTSDLILSYGERLSSFIVSEVIKEIEIDTILVDSTSLIKTDDQFGKASVNFEVTNARLDLYFEEKKHQIYVVPGFIGTSDNNQITTLGRGGTDYTAAIIAAALHLDALEIWTDVSGIYTADPHLVKQARTIPRLSFEEAMELSHFGARVLFPPILQPLQALGIPIYVKNTFRPNDEGTIIHHATESGNTVRGISNIDHVALLTIEGPGMVGMTGFSKRLFDALSSSAVNVIFITQASSEYSICFAVDEKDASVAEKAINNEFEMVIADKKIYPVTVEKELSIIAVIGDHMKNHQGISGKLFSALGRNNTNIRAIAQGASERNISTIIAQKDVRKSLNTLHEAFFEEDVVQLNIFVKGVGNVGQIFLEQIMNQHDYLVENLNLNVRVIGLANSKKMYFNEEGIDLNEGVALLNREDNVVSGTSFIDKIKQLNLRNSVFVDMTASEDVARSYPSYLKNSIAVVTCNKIACASDYTYYKQLKDLSRKYNAPFLFETSVGAGLPIIDTLKNLIASGDRVHQIKAVLSGSLNFIFNTFNEKISFEEAVKQAQLEGYTEPNPLIDLSGIDVQRKLMILVRESGYRIEFNDVDNHSFLPADCADAIGNNELYLHLKHNQKYFENLYNEASMSGGRLKFVATFQDGVAKVCLENIPPTHDFYHLEGKDNIVLFYTDRYKEQPLLIKGAGAGAAVTASGIFADVIRIGNKMI